MGRSFCISAYKSLPWGKSVTFKMNKMEPVSIELLSSRTVREREREMFTFSHVMYWNILLHNCTNGILCPAIARTEIALKYALGTQRRKCCSVLRQNGLPLQTRTPKSVVFLHTNAQSVCCCHSWTVPEIRYSCSVALAWPKNKKTTTELFCTGYEQEFVI